MNKFFAIAMFLFLPAVSVTFDDRHRPGGIRR